MQFFCIWMCENSSSDYFCVAIFSEAKQKIKEGVMKIETLNVKKILHLEKRSWASSVESFCTAMLRPKYLSYKNHKKKKKPQITMRLLGNFRERERERETDPRLCIRPMVASLSGADGLWLELQWRRREFVKTLGLPIGFLYRPWDSTETTAFNVRYWSMIWFV